MLDNHHGLVVGSDVTPADGGGKRAAAERMAYSLRRAYRQTLDAGKDQEIKDFALTSTLPVSRPQ